MGTSIGDSHLEPLTEAWLNNLHEPAVWLDSSGRIGWLNSAASQTIPSADPVGHRLEEWFNRPEAGSSFTPTASGRLGILGIQGPRWRWFRTLISSYGAGELCIFNEITSEYNQALAYHSSLDVFLHLLTQAPVSQEIYDRILDVAVKVVPGAEAGSLQMLEDGQFRFASQIGFSNELYRHTLAFDWVLGWYGLDMDDWNLGKPRLLASPEIQNRTAHQLKGQSQSLFINYGKLRTIKANLAVPVVLQGRVMALLNLDSLTNAQAFTEESLVIAQTFAVQMAAVIYGVISREHLAVLALTDSLTSLGNRHALDVEFIRLKAQAERLGLPLSIIYWDVDGLKDLNDRQGHSAGDQALKILAAALKGTSRQSDSAFRIGGDEFVSLHIGMPIQETQEFIDRIRRQLHVGVSAGAVAITTLMDLSKALMLSDEAMYQNKRRSSEA